MVNPERVNPKCKAEFMETPSVIKEFLLFQCTMLWNDLI